MKSKKHEDKAQDVKLIKKEIKKAIKPKKKSKKGY
jgi:hypothetical protein